MHCTPSDSTTAHHSIFHIATVLSTTYFFLVVAQDWIQGGGGDKHKIIRNKLWCMIFWCIVMVVSVGISDVVD
jgi:hypothetical protein